MTQATIPAPRTDPADARGRGRPLRRESRPPTCATPCSTRRSGGSSPRRPRAASCGSPTRTGTAASTAIVEALADRLSPRILEQPAALDPVARELEQYFAGRRTRVRPPARLVARARRSRAASCAPRSASPTAQVATYGDVAERAGSPGGSRAAGNALGSNPMPIVVPCHRVVRSRRRAGRLHRRARAQGAAARHRARGRARPLGAGGGPGKAAALGSRPMAGPRAQNVVDIDDPDDPGTVWRFDMRFMRSNYHCIWGQGCRSVRGDGSSQGCCSHGVYVEGGDWDEADRGEAAEVDAARPAADAGGVAEPRRRRQARRLGPRARARQRPHARAPRRLHLLQRRHPPQRPRLRAAPGRAAAAARTRATGSRAPAGRCRCTSSTTRTLSAGRSAPCAAATGARPARSTGGARRRRSPTPPTGRSGRRWSRSCAAPAATASTSGSPAPAAPPADRRASPCRAAGTACAGTRPTCRRSSASAARRACARSA